MITWAFILVENYLQFFADEFVLFEQLFASFDASTFFADLVEFVILELFDAFPALEFLPNIVFTSYFSRLSPCDNRIGKIDKFIHKIC